MQGRRSVFGIGATPRGSTPLVGGGGRVWGDSPGKKKKTGGLRGCILKPSEDNFTAFSPAYFFFFFMTNFIFEKLVCKNRSS